MGTRVARIRDCCSFWLVEHEKRGVGSTVSILWGLCPAASGLVALASQN